MVKLNKKKMTEQEEFKILQNICKYKTAEKCAKGDNFGTCDCEHCKVLTKFKNQINSDFTVYCPQKSSKGYECIPYSFYGSLTSFSEDEDLINFLRNCFYTEKECKEWIEKQGEQKLDDKIKPKFNVGDWVVLSTSDGEKVVQIDSIEYFKSGEPRYITSEGRWFGNGTKAHLWTIQDAKDGDVLYSIDSKRPFIYKERSQLSQAIGYCCINIFGEFAIWNTSKCAICVDKYIPATKEQRDLLFQKMKEVGYEFNFTTKELKKINKK